MRELHLDRQSEGRTKNLREYDWRVHFIGAEHCPFCITSCGLASSTARKLAGGWQMAADAKPILHETTQIWKVYADGDSAWYKLTLERR